MFACWSCEHALRKASKIEKFGRYRRSWSRLWWYANAFCLSNNRADFVTFDALFVTFDTLFRHIYDPDARAIFCPWAFRLYLQNPFCKWRHRRIARQFVASSTWEICAQNKYSYIFDWKSTVAANVRVNPRFRMAGPLLASVSGQLSTNAWARQPFLKLFVLGTCDPA